MKTVVSCSSDVDHHVFCCICSPLMADLYFMMLDSNGLMINLSQKTVPESTNHFDHHCNIQPSVLSEENLLFFLAALEGGRIRPFDSNLLPIFL